MPERPTFAGAANIAIKVPEYKYVDTVRFYRETLGLEQLEEHEGSVCFRFGAMRLWIDRMKNYSRSDVWLEVATHDVPQADKYLESKGVPRRDEVEALPKDLQGFWVSDPAGTIILIDSQDVAHRPA